MANRSHDHRLEACLQQCLERIEHLEDRSGKLLVEMQHLEDRSGKLVVEMQRLQQCRQQIAVKIQRLQQSLTLATLALGSGAAAAPAAVTVAPAAIEAVSSAAAQGPRQHEGSEDLAAVGTLLRAAQDSVANGCRPLLQLQLDSESNVGAASDEYELHLAQAVLEMQAQPIDRFQAAQAAARAYDEVEAAHRCCPNLAAAAAQFPEAFKAARDLLVARVCLYAGYSDRHVFESTLATAFGRPVGTLLNSQLLNSYKNILVKHGIANTFDSLTER